MTTASKTEPFGNLGRTRLGALTIQQITQDLTGNPMETEEAIQLAPTLMENHPSLEQAVDAVLAENPLPHQFYHLIMDWLEDLAHQSAARTSQPTKQHLAQNH